MQTILEHEDERESAITEALARAVRFLEKARTADGRWLDFRFRFTGFHTKGRAMP